MARASNRTVLRTNVCDDEEEGKVVEASMLALLSSAQQ